MKRMVQTPGDNGEQTPPETPAIITRQNQHSQIPAHPPKQTTAARNMPKPPALAAQRTPVIRPRSEKTLIGPHQTERARTRTIATHGPDARHHKPGPA